MAGENSPEARAKADSYAKQQTAQARKQMLNEKVGAPVVKIGTKTQVIKKGGGVVKPLKSTTTSTTVTATEAYDTDPNAYIHDSFSEKGGKGIQNPPFVYPGNFDRSVDPKQSVRINRGYIRRLTEFYDKQQAGDPGTLALTKASPSTVQNMRCNFQFNPDNITRMVTAESDMTFFFNQDPSQLAQPVPGKAGFAFELLFNREAEVTNKVYLTKDEKPISVPVDVSDDDPIGVAANWIGKPHDPSWVAKIGVLADILILDDVIGQGLAKDILDKINDPTAYGPNGTRWGFDATNSPGSPTTSTTSGSTTTKAIDGKRYDAYSMNMGNKAYLTPTPVRIMFTKWMMVEGFVQSVQVTFNKFSRNMIPTQASVMIQMQALYIGFAQQKTFLTDLPNIQVGQGASPGNTTPAPGTVNDTQYKYIDGLLSKGSFFDKQDTINRNQSSLIRTPVVQFVDLFRISSTTDLTFGTDKETGIVKYGAEVLRQLKSDKINYEIKWDGVLKVYWDSHAVASNGSELSTRQLVPVDAPSGYIYKPGPPPNATAPDTDYKLWGTKSEPMVFTSIGNTGYPKVGGFGFGPNLNFFGKDRMYLSDTDVTTVMNGHTWTLRIRDSKTATETLRINNQLKVPFKQDKFTYELGIRWYIQELTYDFPIYLYDWHKGTETEEISKFHRYNNSPTDKTEWFRADLKAMDYRVKGTGANQDVTGNGVSWFNDVRIYLGGTL